jgi:hypothetical protein
LKISRERRKTAPLKLDPEEILHLFPIENISGKKEGKLLY